MEDDNGGARWSQDRAARVFAALAASQPIPKELADMALQVLGVTMANIGAAIAATESCIPPGAPPAPASTMSWGLAFATGNMACAAGYSREELPGFLAAVTAGFNAHLLRAAAAQGKAN